MQAVPTKKKDITKVGLRALGLLSVVRKGWRLGEGEWPRDMVDAIASQSTPVVAQMREEVAFNMVGTRDTECLVWGSGLSVVHGFSPWSLSESCV